MHGSPEAAREAVYLNARLIAHDLCEVGINVDCLPVLDVPVDGADAIIGDRAFARDPATIIDLGRAAIEGLIEGGVLPVMKHIPGHGRATADSHLALPRVATDRGGTQRHGLRDVPQPQPLPDGDDGACHLRADRSAASGDHEPESDSRRDSRRNGIRRAC